MTDAAVADLPLSDELHSAISAEAAFVKLAARPHVLFLDSALRHSELGRYSFSAADPYEVLTVPIDGAGGWAAVEDRLLRWTAATLPGLPPFQGGAAGVFSYDLGRSLECLPAPRFDEFRLPAISLGFYDVVLAFDHALNRSWLISQGLPETDPQRRRARALQRMRQFQNWLSSPAERSDDAGAGSIDRVGKHDLAPQFPVGEISGLTSDFTAAEYRQAVRRAVDYICAGDVFQVNLSQRLLYPAQNDAVSLYLRLRQRNPATFAGYFDLGRYQIVSASPERFLALRDRCVETRPIKGTRQRTLQPEADLFAGDELRQSEKDRAENVMIVDLLRNDLSRVCEPDSVRVSQLCELEVYEYVQHLVSAVRGKLAIGCSPLDLIRAAFPGGSITGAPKVRAMEIIAELEPTARGAYCGSLGYIGFDGAMDLSILIRTITAGAGWWQMPVGGGIVAQSNVDREYEETWHKAAGLLQAIAR